MKLLSLLSLAASALAHGGIYSYDINGTIYQGYLPNPNPNHPTNPPKRNPWHTFDYGDGNTTAIPPNTPSIQRRWYFWPIYAPDIMGSNITCNYDGAATTSSLHAPIAAGGTITAHYDTRDFNLTAVGRKQHRDPRTILQKKS